MKKYATLLTICLTVWAVSNSFAQAPSKASDFTVTDCNGIEHHLFAELDKGNVVIMEVVMGCLPCVQGRQALSSIESGFAASAPGKVQTYTFGFSGSVDCSSIGSWMSDNNFTGITFAGDDDINASYGAAGGMPTICIVGGADHKVLYWKKGFSKKDTVAMKTAISNALAQASVSSATATESVTVFPNPAASAASISIDCATSDTRQIDLYNAAGIKLFSIFNSILPVGPHSIKFSTEQLANGTYYIRVTTAGITTVVPVSIVH